MKKQIYAAINLTVQLGFHILKRLSQILTGRPNGPELFTAYYKDDRTLPISKEDRAGLPNFQGCINCGLCSLDSDELLEWNYEMSMGPESLPVALSRALPDLWTAKDVLSCYLDYGRYTRVCPRQVPFEKIAEFMKKYQI